MDVIKNLAVVVVVVMAISGWYSHQKLSSCEEDRSYYMDRTSELRDEVIEAKSYAWSSYEDMGNALDALSGY